MIVLPDFQRVRCENFACFICKFVVLSTHYISKISQKGLKNHFKISCTVLKISIIWYVLPINIHPGGCTHNHDYHTLYLFKDGKKSILIEHF